VDDAARRLAAELEIDEARDVVRWSGGTAGLHDYAALYAVPGLYEAIYYERLGGRSPVLLADALAAVVKAPGAVTVLDVGAGTGSVGSALRDRGFSRIVGTDIEPASCTAIARDHGEVYADARVCDLVAPSAGDRAWLAAVAPDVVTVAGAVGFGHLPVAAFATLTRDVLRAGGLLAVTVAHGWEADPALAGHADLFTGAAFTGRDRRPGLHRRRADGGPDLTVDALVLERTAA